MRKAACSALGEIGSQAVTSVPALFDLLRSEEDSESARNALRRIDNVEPDIVPFLIAALDTDDRRTRFYAVYYLGKIGPAAKDALPALRSLSEGDSGRFRGALQRAIEAIEHDEESVEE